MTTLTYYVIRHKATGELMPLMMRGRGYSHWNPSTQNKVYAIEDTPRLLKSEKQAHKVISGWFHCPNAYDQDGDLMLGKMDGRRKEDLEVVPITIRMN
jgi:hypothetical protein